jgi:type IV secretion system protein VirB1
VKVVLDFNTLTQQCAPNVHPTTLQAVVRTESGFNPFAIGVVGGHLARQPRSLPEAVTTAKALDAQGINFSMGLGQMNKANLAQYGLTYQTAFDLCANLKAGANILHSCYTRAVTTMGVGDQAVRAAISCYYSGSFTRGFKADFRGTSYVQRVSANALATNPPIDAVPAIPVVMDRTTPRVSDRPKIPAAVADARQRQPQTHPSWDAFGDYPCQSDSTCK